MYIINLLFKEEKSECYCCSKSKQDTYLRVCVLQNSKEEVIKDQFEEERMKSRKEDEGTTAVMTLIT